MRKIFTLGLTLILSLVMIVGAALPLSADALGDLCAEFPISGTTFTYIALHGDTSYIQATLGGDSWLNGTYYGWCARTDQELTAGDSWIAYCSYNLTDPSLIQYPANLPKVNWILNQAWPSPYTGGDIQAAIWALLGFNGDKSAIPQAALDDLWAAPADMTAGGRVDTILTGANANPAYEPPAGGKLVLVVKPALSSVGFSVQTVLITIDIPDEPGDEGCTPGFWKGNADNKGAYAWVDYLPGDDFSDTFGISEQVLRANGKNTYTNPTLREALDANGSGINLLARSAVAALLNAANPDIAYPMTESEIIQAVQDAIDGIGAYTIQELGELLDSYNNLGCPIDQQWD